MKKSGPLQYFGSFLVLAVFAASAWLLVDQIKQHELTLEKIRANLMEIPLGCILAALALTVLNYAVLVAYDYLAFRFAKVPISAPRVTFAAITSYSFSYNFGATLTGVPLRYRLYTAWNIPLGKIVQLLVILALTFWFGVFTMAGGLFVFNPLQIPPEKLQQISENLVREYGIQQDAVGWLVYLLSDSRPFGVVLLAMSALYVGTSLLHRGSLKIFRWSLPVPPPRLTIYQIAIASADMLVAGSVLYVLFPPIIGGYWKLLEVYLVAYVIIVLTHVPGGWGVLEAMMVTLLTSLQLIPDPVANVPKVFAAIVVFRVIYFLLPLAIGAALVAWHEYALRKNWIAPVIPVEGEAAGAEPAPKGLNGRARERGQPDEDETGAEKAVT